MEWMGGEQHEAHILLLCCCRILVYILLFRIYTLIHFPLELAKENISHIEKCGHYTVEIDEDV
jgi:hypothetical protein